MDRAALARDIDAACRVTGSFTLRSGRQASEYFDKYLFESQPALLRAVAEAMVPLLPESTDLVGGLELWGIPLATMVSSLTGLPVVFVRKAAKEYGTRRLAEGAEVGGRQVTLIEDVITTGGAVRDAARALRALGAAVDVVICAIDRSGVPGGPLTGDGIETRAVFSKADLDAAREDAPGAIAGHPVEVRPTRPIEYEAVEALIRAAFWDVYRPGCIEDVIYRQLTESAAYLPELDLVAVHGEEVVGHLILTRATVTADDGSVREILCAGPLAVSPALQRNGIGAQLMTAGIDRATSLGFAGVVLFGSPDYYPRFGFEDASRFAITTADGTNFAAFMARELGPGALAGVSGRFAEDTAFHIEPVGVDPDAVSDTTV
ncbi:MAG: orotate phosphoribosyltransferase [Tetrasphaera sp.]